MRVAQVGEKGAQLLLYKDSRCDKRILDETFGIEGWRNFYQEIKGNLFCTIEIWDIFTKQWIAKSDCGVESFSEKEKGEASDAFKRAGFNIGIGRELYTKIFIFVPCKTKKNDKGKWELEDRFLKFYVKDLTVDEDREIITSLVIEDNNGNIVFTYPKKNKANIPAPESKTKQPSEPTLTITEAQGKLLYMKANRDKDLIARVCKEYNYKSVAEIEKEKFNEIIGKIEKLKLQGGSN